MIQRWDPFNDLRQMQRTMDRLWRRGAANPDPSDSPGIEAWAVPLDVVQSGNDTLIRASIPGVLPENISVSIEDNVLTIKGRTDKRYANEGGAYLMQERRTGSYHRSLRLPDSVDPNKAQSLYEHGVLTVTIPKAEAKRARQLQVQVGDSPSTSG